MLNKARPSGGLLGVGKGGGSSTRQRRVKLISRGMMSLIVKGCATSALVKLVQDEARRNAECEAIPLDFSPFFRPQLA